MQIDDVNSHFGSSNGPPPSIMQSKICGGGRRVVASSMATNEASIELKMLAFATAVKMAVRAPTTPAADDRRASDDGRGCW
jgi:hypothetical protein